MTAAKGVFFEDLSVGQEASLSNTVSGAHIVALEPNAFVVGDRSAAAIVIRPGAVGIAGIAPIVGKVVDVIKRLEV